MFLKALRFRDGPSSMLRYVIYPPSHHRATMPYIPTSTQRLYRAKISAMLRPGLSVVSLVPRPPFRALLTRSWARLPGSDTYHEHQRLPSNYYSGSDRWQKSYRSYCWWYARFVLALLGALLMVDGLNLVINRI